MEVLGRIGISVLIILSVAVDVCYSQNTAEQAYFKGVEYGAEGKFKEARKQFQKALKVDPSDESAKAVLKIIEDANKQKIKGKTAIHLFKGISHDNIGQWDEAIAEYNKAIEINPRYAHAYDTRGAAYGIKGQYDKAISDFNKAIEINPRFASAYNNRGIAYGGKGQYEKAISDFTKVIEINPKFAKAYYNRGMAYYSKGQNEHKWAAMWKSYTQTNGGFKYERLYDQAISDYTKAIEINPRYAMAYGGRGAAYCKKGQYNKAISDCTKAMEINPRFAPAYMIRGIAYYTKGNMKKACSDWKRACELGNCRNYEIAKGKGLCE